MTTQYDRKAILIVRNKVKGQEITIEDLRINFKIDKNNESNSNSSQISVYNMNSDNRAIFGQTGNEMVLFAGYAGGVRNQTIDRILFSGDISRAATEKKGPDFITKFEAGDKEIAIEETVFDKTYASNSGTKIRSIIKDIAKKMGLIVNDENIKSLDDKLKFENPVTFSGTAKTAMDDLVNKAGLEWNVQDGELRVRNKSDSDTIDIISLSKNSGLIGIPISREEGISFVALLNPLIKPTVTVNIISEQTAEDLNGNFVVTKAIYTGDTREGDWQVSCEAVKVDS